MTPVIVVAVSRAEAEELSELLLGDHVIDVGYIHRTRFDILRDSS